MKTIKLAVIAAAAATTALLPYAPAFAQADERPMWDALKKSYEARRAGIPEKKEQATSRQSVVTKEAKAPYEQSRAGQAEADRSTGPYHLLEKHNP